MSSKIFLDTNILVYAYDPASPTKQSIAKTILDTLGRNRKGVVSTQKPGTGKYKEPKNAEIARLVNELPAPFHQRYLAREGYFGNARSSQAPRRLQTCAQDIWLLLQLFANNPTIADLKQFKTLKRLFKEQCEIVGGTDEQKVQAKLPDRTEDANADSTPPERDTTGSEPTTEAAEPSTAPIAEATVQVKDQQEIGSDSLQSPTDPDATYGHKGKGYEYQIAETCATDNPFQVITQTQLNGANESDQTQTIPMLEKLVQANSNRKNSRSMPVM